MSYGAAGLRVTMPSNNNGTDLNNVIENNTFEAILEPTGNTYPDANYYAWAVLLEGVYANCCPLFIDNTFESNDTSLKLGSGDGYDVLDGNFISNTFSLSSVPSDLTYAAVTAGYSTGDLHNVTIIDPSYANGASQTVVWDPSALAWPSADNLPRTVDFGWLLTVEADDANGDPLSGATVDVFDNSGNPVFSGVTDASGQLADISVVTTIYQQSATDLSDTTTQACGPFQVQVSLAGYATSTQTINLTQSTTAQFQLSSGTVVTVNAPTNLSATDPASASITLSWTDNASNATSYTVERSDGTTGDWSVIASNLPATATSYADNNVTAGSSYSYEVAAFDGTIESPDSNVASATVSSATPAAPSNLVAMAAALPASVSLSWTDNDPNATSYVVERSDGTTGDWTVIASNLAATATSYTDGNVTAGASYSYQVEAFDGTTGSPDSNVASATVPYATPAAPSNLLAMAAALPASVSLSWTDNADNATGYTVERSDGTTGDWTVIASNLAATATSYTDGNVTAGASYSYQVEAFNVTAGSSCSNAASATVPYATPAAPSNLLAMAAALPASVSLSWTDNAAIATAYTVERSVGTTGVWTVIAGNLSATATSYTDGNVTAGASYSYQVEAFNVTAGSSCSNAASATVPYATPAAPTKLSAKASASPAGVSLSWTDNTAIATAYVVERSVGTAGVWTVIASNLAATATNYTDSKVTAGATYSYQVEALNVTAVSPFSNVASAAVPYATPAAPTKAPGQGVRFAGRRQSVLDRQHGHRDCLRGGALRRHNGHLDRHRQQSRRHGHQLHGQQGDGRGDVQLSGRGP